MAKSGEMLTIGQTAARCGLAPSALRFYETRGLIRSHRGSGNQRRFHRAEIRKIAVIKVAQNLGLTLAEIQQALSTLPENRVPNRRDWENLSRHWRTQLDQRIASLQRLRQNLSGCIGCGCLSLGRCNLYNKGDLAANDGVGPRYLLDENAISAKHDK